MATETKTSKPNRRLANALRAAGEYNAADQIARQPWADVVRRPNLVRDLMELAYR